MMSDDLFELFENDEGSKKKGRQHRANARHDHHRDDVDDDDFSNTVLSDRWHKISKNKWLLAGIILIGVLCVVVTVYLVVLLIPLLAEFLETDVVQNSTQIAKTFKSFAAG